ncbi:ubiquitin-specific protease otu1 [Coemansia sp. Benny D160-2]|nr:ubiquitin-specific protease otu1 [Coemansia sp. Benny D160-2]
MWLNIEKNNETTRFAHNRGTATFGQLKDQLSQVSNIPRNSLIVKLGIPPTAADYSDSTLLVHTPFYENTNVVVATAGEAAALTQVAGAEAHPQHSMGPIIPARDERVGDIWAEFKGGYLVRRVVPGDNSCLFTSLSNCLGHPGLSAGRLREIVSECIREDPEQFNEAMLGMPVNQYCEWIENSNNWGGGIEMAAISARYHVEVCSIDIKSLRIDRFGEGKYARRVVLLYSGTHYDYIAHAASIDSPREFDQTEFETGFTSNDDDALLAAAITLAKKLNERHGFVSVSQPELKCGECGVFVRGEYNAKRHAVATQHKNYVQM